jgi:hypothetical protein
MCACLSLNIVTAAFHLSHELMHDAVSAIKWCRSSVMLGAIEEMLKECPTVVL